MQASTACGSPVPVVVCNGTLPELPANSNSTGFPSACVGVVQDTTCSAACASGYAGSYDSSCTQEGNWTAPTGSCGE